MSKVYPPKNVRLQQLRESNLNIADFIHFPINCFDEEVAKKFFEKYHCVSVRTFATSELLIHATPLKYEMTDFEVVKEFCKEQNKTYNLLMNQVIKIKDAGITGKIAWFDNQNYHIDFFYGEGTPRYMDDDHKIDLHTATGSIGNQPQNLDSQLLSVVEKTKTAISDFRPIIFEFQLYPYDIGMRNEKLIFWEWLSFGGK
ncbi:MAG: hypothetical protein V1644_04000 [Candidatus Micrarchaeota archaeon]